VTERERETVTQQKTLLEALLIKMSWWQNTQSRSPVASSSRRSTDVA